MVNYTFLRSEPWKSTQTRIAHCIDTGGTSEEDQPSSSLRHFFIYHHLLFYAFFYPIDRKHDVCGLRVDFSVRVGTGGGRTPGACCDWVGGGGGCVYLLKALNSRLRHFDQWGGAPGVRTEPPACHPIGGEECGTKTQTNNTKEKISCVW